MKTYSFLSLSKHLVFVIFSVATTLLKAQSIEGSWQFENYSLTFQDGMYAEIIDEQVSSTGWYQFDGTTLLLQDLYGRQFRFSYQCDGEHLALLLDERWVLLEALYPNTYEAESYGMPVPAYTGGDNDYIMNLTQQVVADAIRVAGGGMTEEEYQQVEDNMSIDTRAVIGHTQSVYQLQGLMERASQGDYEAQQELENRMKWLEQMSGMLEVWTASGQISNSVRKHQVASEWKRAAHEDRGWEEYYKQQGDRKNAQFHAERAEEFDKGSEKILK